MQERLLLASFLVAAAGCEQVDSDAIRNEGIYANFLVSSDGDDATVQAALTVGGPSGTYMKLTAGDELVVHANNDSETLSGRSGTWGDIEYRTGLDAPATDSEIKIDFIREGHSWQEEACRGGSLRDNRVTMPRPFTIKAPLEDASLEEDEVTVRWTEASAEDEMLVSISGSCVASEGARSSDDGRATLRFDRVEPGSCRATITVRRQRQGHVDSGFGEGGIFVAEQVREIDVQIRP